MSGWTVSELSCGRALSWCQSCMVWENHPHIWSQMGLRSKFRVEQNESFPVRPLTHSPHSSHAALCKSGHDIPRMKSLRRSPLAQDKVHPSRPQSVWLLRLPGSPAPSLTLPAGAPFAPALPSARTSDPLAAFPLLILHVLV